MKANTGCFAEVARIIGKRSIGAPSDWIEQRLLHWSPLVGGRKATKADDVDDQRLFAAAQELEKGLRTYALAEEKYGLRCDDSVHAVFTALPELIEYLEEQCRKPRKGGPAPDGRRLVCAAVCAECWRRERGEIQPRSPDLWKACEEYWKACGSAAQRSPLDEPCGG